MGEGLRITGGESFRSGCGELSGMQEQRGRAPLEVFSGEDLTGQGEDLVDLQEHYDNVMLLLAKKIERSQELNPTAKQALKQQIQQHLAAMGLHGDYEEQMKQLSGVAGRLHDAEVNPPTPKDFPSRDELESRIQKITQGRSKPKLSLPTVTPLPNALEVARYGHANWRQVTGRGRSITDDVYGIGRVMNSRYAYSRTFGREDPIAVDGDWNIVNGRHRVLTLRVLGPDYVRRHHMDRWVKAVRDKGEF